MQVLQIAKPVVQNRFLKGLVTSGVSVSVANVATMPMGEHLTRVLTDKYVRSFCTSVFVCKTNTNFAPGADVTKVRLQLQAIRMADGTKPPGLVSVGALVECHHVRSVTA